MAKLRILYVASEINPFLTDNWGWQFRASCPKPCKRRAWRSEFWCPFWIDQRAQEPFAWSGSVKRHQHFGGRWRENLWLSKLRPSPTLSYRFTLSITKIILHRKSVFHDKENRFYEDNDERAIFFCKGAIETVRKLGWAPDIVHCNDWITSFIPLYLKTTYKERSAL